MHWTEKNWCGYRPDSRCERALNIPTSSFTESIYITCYSTSAGKVMRSSLCPMHWSPALMIGVMAVTTADGRTFSGSALVAADGVRSFFRQKLIGDGEPRPSGYAALRTIVPMEKLKVDVPRDSVVLWGGPGYHVIHYPLRHGSEFNIVAVYRTATHAEKADVATCRAELEQVYRGAHPSMRA